jgi:nucleotide-binding universal stress UspA family protein
MARPPGAGTLEVNCDEENTMILLAYDGSPDAQAAIDHAAQLMPGSPVTVTTVWEPLIDALMRSGSMGAGVGMGGFAGDAVQADADNRAAALERATEGAARATALGLVATARCATRRSGLAHTILAAAAQVDAGVIVMGTRGLSGVKSFLLGSVSHGVVQHADCSVLIVPSAALAEQRHNWVHTDAVPV